MEVFETIRSLYHNTLDTIEQENKDQKKIKQATYELRKQNDKLTIELVLCQADHSRIEEYTSLMESGIGDLKQYLSSIIDVAPNEQFFKHYNIFAGQLRSVSEVILSFCFLKYDKLYSYNGVQKLLFGDRDISEISIDLDTYFMALMSTCSRIRLLTISAALAGDMEFVKRSHHFVSNVLEGLSRLTFKNGEVRRRYDSLKYKSKEIEMVMNLMGEK
ncbi:hypothetical protein ACOME3_008764 [Neoechinorhynchus agilis]